MKKLVLIVLVLILYSVSYSATPTCDFYASPTGTGTAGSSSNPFQIATFVARTDLPGKTLCLMDGTYTSTTSLVNISSKSGTSTQPIRMVALNEGQVVISGSNTRRPFGVFNSSYWIFEGMDVCCADTASIDSDFQLLYIGTGSNNNIFRRIVAYDGYRGDGSNLGKSNPTAFELNNNSNNVLEDIAAFGYFTKGFEAISTNGTRLTRGWFQFTYSADNAPRQALTVAYHAYNGLYENIIASWKEIVPSGSPAVNCDPSNGDGCGAILSTDHMTGDTDKCTNLRVLGSLSIFPANASALPNPFVKPGGMAVGNFQDIDCATWDNVVSYVAPDHTATKPFHMVGFGGGASKGHFARNLTSIGPVLSQYDADWSKTNVVDYLSITAMNNANANPFRTTTGNGARLCFEYQNGTITTTPLWPWRMSSRIVTAIQRSGRSVTQMLNGANTIEAQVESIFGPIPAGCRRGGVLLTTTITSPTSNPTLTHNANTIKLGGTVK